MLCIIFIKVKLYSVLSSIYWQQIHLPHGGSLLGKLYMRGPKIRLICTYIYIYQYHLIHTSSFKNMLCIIFDQSQTLLSFMKYIFKLYKVWLWWKVIQHIFGKERAQPLEIHFENFKLTSHVFKIYMRQILTSERWT
jgi:hypothetical protein